MLSSTLFTLASALVVTMVKAQSLGTIEPANATPVIGNPPGATYIATLPATEFFNPEDPRGNVKGSIIATSGPGGVGTTFKVNFSNLPTSGGPFPYHIHVAPVNSTGSCASTLAHLDPFIRGEDPVCDASKPETCQVGDLSGKYGKVTSDPFYATYTDPYTSNTPGLGSFYGNRSFVLHFGNKTRITCANFVKIHANGTASPTGSGIGYGSEPTVSTVPFLGAANTVGVSVIALLGALAGLMFL